MTPSFLAYHLQEGFTKPIRGLCRGESRMNDDGVRDLSVEKLGIQI